MIRFAMPFFICVLHANKILSNKLTHRGPAMLLTFLGPSGVVYKTFMAELLTPIFLMTKKVRIYCALT